MSPNFQILSRSSSSDLNIDQAQRPSDPKGQIEQVPKKTSDFLGGEASRPSTTGKKAGFRLPGKRAKKEVPTSVKASIAIGFLLIAGILLNGITLTASFVEMIGLFGVGALSFLIWGSLYRWIKREKGWE